MRAVVLGVLLLSASCATAPADPGAAGPSVPPGDAASDGQNSRDGAGGAGAPDAGDDARAPSDAGQEGGGAVDGAALGAGWHVVADATGIQRIERYGANLLEGVGGYYVIGSCTGADDANNVTSQGSDGRTLHAPGTCPGAPFHMTVTPTNPVRVSIDVGPLPVAYRTLSVPLDPTRDYFDHFAFDGVKYDVGCANSFQPRSGSGGPFDSIPQPCTIPGVGAVGLARVRPVPGWGAISGPLGTFRRTFTQVADAKELAFIRHPGTHNIEPGFAADDPIPAGSSVHFEEEIALFDPPTLPVTTHEAELSFGHDIGRRDGDGWSAATNLDPAGFLAYGPYLTLSPGVFGAVFRLLVDNNDANSDVVVRIEASDYDGNKTLATREVRRTDFAAPNAYQDFALQFTAPATPRHRIELRTYWLARAYIRLDRVQLHWPM